MGRGVQTDSSDMAVADGVITQKEDGNEYVVAYASQKLNGPRKTT